MNRIDIATVLWKCALGFCALVQGYGAYAAESLPPNVVVFLVDDLGYMDIGANNPDCFYETPNIDCLANSGMRFTDGYAANPVCSPTRYSLMTGKYPTRVDATNFFPEDAGGGSPPRRSTTRCPWRKSRSRGLEGAWVCHFLCRKMDLGPSEPYFPQNRGFDVNIGGYFRGGPYTGNKYFPPFDNPQMADDPEDTHLPDRFAHEPHGSLPRTRIALFWLIFPSIRYIHR